MKRAHIVYAHPEVQSFVAAMRDIAAAALQSAGWHTTLTDLTAEQFDPVASAADFGNRSCPEYLVYPHEQRCAWETRSIHTEIAAEVNALLESDLLVLVFPVFWFSVPAQMKGWIDRVFLSGPLYGEGRTYDRGGMRGKRALVVASLGGRDAMFGPSALHGDLKGMLRHLLQGTLGYVGYSVLDPYLAYHGPCVDADAGAEILMRLWNDLQQLETRAVLPMPRLDDFDAHLRPR